MSIARFLLIAAIAAGGCSGGSVNEQEMTAYIADPENGLIQTIASGGIEMMVYYRPVELVMADEFRSMADDADRKDLMGRYDSLDYFILRLSSDGKELENRYASDPRKFNDVITYFNSYIRDDIEMEVEGETIRPIETAYARTFGASESTGLMIVFDSHLRARKGDVSFIFNDEIFGAGRSEFTFDTDKIKDLPTLKYSR